MSSQKTVIAFDLYGTLLSTESIARALGEIYGEDAAPGLAAQWRRYQLEYTWRANSMNIYRPFSEMTRAALRHAVAEKKLTLSDDVEERLMREYDGLDTFPEIPAALERLGRESNVEAYIFSNGTHAMVSASVATSKVLSAEGGFREPGRLITVEPVEAFKPDPRTYRHLARTTGATEGNLEGIWLVSSNPFDALGAVAAGLSSAWIDRGGIGWVDALGGSMGMKPTIIAGGVDEAIEAILTKVGR
ncbi:haloacid dehalogenase [Plectosphaerella plurivora]|uniref:Haloacid dehalogenase n=1 Tax=Plectosphaerella plurivora TaxID=936078 RepID=A0A9P8V5N6_9PEZI|nr:haloacid dehalogenase [Plectosphaerella plurivora]